jgi:DNA-binding NtrC family response regulator
MKVEFGIREGLSLYKVGYVDDDINAYKDYKIRLKRKGIELQFVENCISLEEILDWVLLNSIECLIVDHKLTAKYAFQGTKVVAYINSQLPDLPCIILTNYPEDSSGENLVVKNLIFDRNIMAKDDLTEICDIIKQAAHVFKNRLSIHLKEYSELLQKRNLGSISADEEESFLALYKVLRSYGEVDDIATELLKPGVNKKIDDLMDKLDQFINSKKE